jgi:tetratricopeptide (TPR) repeat protein
MVEWFRNERWDGSIAEAFEIKLGRARDKAQYLTIQGFTLLASRPDIAAQLLRRAISLNDPDHTARAGLYLGTALAIGGDLDGAIDAMQDAIEAEQRFPMHWTGATLDMALLIALAGRSDLYDLALQQLERERVLPFETQLLSALIARTLILGERGEDVAPMAIVALNTLNDAASSSELPAYLRVDDLRRRLERFAPGR